MGETISNPILTDDQIYSIFFNYKISEKHKDMINLVKETKEMIVKKCVDFDKLEKLSKGELDNKNKEEFKLEMLIDHGNIISYRELDDISPYNLEIENKPEPLKVLEFENGSVLLIQEWGDFECGHIDSYFYDSKKDKIFYSCLV